MNEDFYITDYNNIYGIKMYNYLNVLFEKKYDIIMTNELIKDVKLFYENLDEDNKNNIKFQIYIKCKSICYLDDNIMVWWNISIEDFIKKYTK